MQHHNGFLEFKCPRNTKRCMIRDRPREQQHSVQIPQNASESYRLLACMGQLRRCERMLSAQPSQSKPSTLSVATHCGRSAKRTQERGVRENKCSNARRVKPYHTMRSRAQQRLRNGGAAHVALASTVCRKHARLRNREAVAPGLYAKG